jgi:DNA-binding cell septation regulator SpoVG
MVAFLSVELSSGMVVHDLRLMIGKNGPWIAVNKDARSRR